MRVFLLHPDDDFHGDWTRRQWDAVVDLDEPKIFFMTRGAPNWLSGLQRFRFGRRSCGLADLASPCLRSAWDALWNRFGIDWWSDQSGAAAGVAGCQFALRLAENLRGCRTLATSRCRDGRSFAIAVGYTAASAFSRGLRERLVPRILRRGATRGEPSFVQLAAGDVRQVRSLLTAGVGKRAGERRRGHRSSLSRFVLLPSAYSNVTKTALSYAESCLRRNFLLVLAPSPEQSRGFHQM